jgi:hypothetical protein
MTASAQLDRRTLLKRAALAAGAVALGSAADAGRAFGGGIGPDGPIDAFEGSLLAVGPSTLVVERWNASVTLEVSALSTLWKGGDVPISSFKVGDTVLVRTVAGSLTDAWANLEKVRGTIIGATPRGYEVRDGHGNLTEVVFSGTTRMEDALGKRQLPPARFDDGTWVDAAGLGVDGTIFSSIVRYQLPGTQPRAAKMVPPRVTYSEDRITSFEYRSFASWYSCCTGCGGCSSPKCNTSNSSQTAWPALSACGCCTGTCCDCAKNCLAQAYLSCGTAVIVTDPCTNISNTCTIVDCGPCNNVSCKTCSPGPTCSHTCSICGGNPSPPIVDLTKPTFTVFRNPANYGCTLANVKNGV